MIARIWRGRVPAGKADAYLDVLRRTSASAIWRGYGPQGRGGPAAAGPSAPRQDDSIVKDHPGLESGVSMARCP